MPSPFEYKHGHASTKTKKSSPTYRTWNAMTQRCNNPKHAKYWQYGAKGITVHPRWLDFQNFLADMGERPEGTTIDRIESAKGYEPGNCRWSTPIEQQNNLRSNVWLEFNGERKTVSQWARTVGMRPCLISWRIKRGWSVEHALTVAPFTGNRPHLRLSLSAND